MIEAWRVRFGLDEPMAIQYLRYIRNSVTFDLGYSLAYFPSEVSDMIRRALPWTLGLVSIATLISFAMGNLMGR